MVTTQKEDLGLVRRARDLRAYDREETGSGEGGVVYVCVCESFFVYCNGESES